MLFALLLSIVCALSTASALPVSLLPVRPYVFLAPELPKFQLQPTVKVQPSTPAQPSATAPKPDASRQYVLVYPYQYVATRQDEASGTGFFETIQNFFVNFGQQQQQQNDENQSLDAVELDKPGVAPTAAPAAEGEKPAAAAAAPTKSDSKQKIVYSYLTPASTVPLNADRRLFFLAEQPQLFGSFSGPSVNPVFNLQPVPILASRSNVAQSQPDEPQPGKIVSENVQKFSQTPPVMASDEKTAEVKTTEIKPVEFKSVELPTIELKSIETPTHEVKTNELLVPELKSIELPAPEIKTVELPTPELKTVELPTPEVTIHELPAPELKPVELTPIEPVLKSTVIQEQTDSLQVDLAANRVAPIVADNRAIDVPEEIVKVPEVKVDEVSPVILARSSAVPLTITAAEIPVEKPADPLPVELNDAVQEAVYHSMTNAPVDVSQLEALRETPAAVL